MKANKPLLIFMIIWAAAPFSVGVAIDAALQQGTQQQQIGASVCFWIGWGLVLGSCIIRRPWGLTAMRVLTPTTLPALLAAHLYSHISTGTLVLALTHASLASLLSLLPETGNVMVDGLSYGDEKRFLLRVPGAIVVGPLMLLWVVVVLSFFAGPIAVVSENWRTGILLIGVGWPVAGFGFRSIHQLSRRWIVFVPNGFVIHDYLATREPFLLRRQDIISLGPAPVNSETEDEGIVDVSQFALGPVLQVALHGEVEVVPRTRGVSEVKLARNILFSPTRPGAVLQEARLRRLVR